MPIIELLLNIESGSGGPNLVAIGFYAVTGLLVLCAFMERSPDGK